MLGWGNAELALNGMSFGGGNGWLVNRHCNKDEFSLWTYLRGYGGIKSVATVANPVGKLGCATDAVYELNRRCALAENSGLGKWLWLTEIAPGDTTFSINK